MGEKMDRKNAKILFPHKSHCTYNGPCKFNLLTMWPTTALDRD